MNIKKLTEDKNGKMAEMQTLLDKVEKEERAFTEEEQKLFDELKSQVEAINGTIKAFEDARELSNEDENGNSNNNANEESRALEIEERDIKDFASYIRGVLSQRAETESNFAMGSNGVIVPTSIANKIIMTAVNMSPVLEKATKYNTKGKLEIPVYGKGTGGEDITVDYGTDFTDLVAKAGKFTSAELSDYLIGALAKVGNSLVNNTDIDLVNVVINIIAEYIKIFLEKQALIGTAGKITGCSDIPENQTVETAVASVIGYDDLVKVKNKVMEVCKDGM